MLDKKRIVLIVILIISAAFILNYFRYTITGTNQGYIIKTDRFTGKSWAVSSSGEYEIGILKTPREIAEEFNKLKTPQEKSALWDKYVMIKVITKDNVNLIKEQFNLLKNK